MANKKLTIPNADWAEGHLVFSYTAGRSSNGTATLKNSLAISCS